MAVLKGLHALLLCTFICCLYPALGKTPREDLMEANQLLLVTTPGWHSTSGTMQLFTRSGPASRWENVGRPFPVVVGRGGLAWQNLTGDSNEGNIFKREGDGKSPAGILRLSFAFGFVPQSEAGPLRIPYRQITESLKCVDDPDSVYYNMVDDSTTVGDRDWNSAEDMRRIDPAYTWGVYVAHNTEPIKHPAGSCILLHVWDGPKSATSGCTAMEKSRMVKVIQWLDSDANPVLVQLPVTEYLRRKRTWGLP